MPRSFSCCSLAKLLRRTVRTRHCGHALSDSLCPAFGVWAPFWSPPFCVRLAIVPGLPAVPCGRRGGITRILLLRVCASVLFDFSHTFQFGFSVRFLSYFSGWRHEEEHAHSGDRRQEGTPDAIRHDDEDQFGEDFPVAQPSSHECGPGPICLFRNVRVKKVSMFYEWKPVPASSPSSVGQNGDNADGNASDSVPQADDGARKGKSKTSRPSTSKHEKKAGKEPREKNLGIAVRNVWFTLEYRRSRNQVFTEMDRYQLRNLHLHLNFPWVVWKHEHMSNDNWVEVQVFDWQLRERLRAFHAHNSTEEEEAVEGTTGGERAAAGSWVKDAYLSALLRPVALTRNPAAGKYRHAQSAAGFRDLVAGVSATAPDAVAEFRRSSRQSDSSTLSADATTMSESTEGGSRSGGERITKDMKTVMNLGLTLDGDKYETNWTSRKSLVQQEVAAVHHAALKQEENDTGHGEMPARAPAQSREVLNEVGENRRRRKRQLLSRLRCDEGKGGEGGEEEKNFGAEGGERVGRHGGRSKKIKKENKVVVGVLLQRMQGYMHNPGHVLLDEVLSILRSLQYFDLLDRRKYTIYLFLNQVEQHLDMYELLVGEDGRDRIFSWADIAAGTDEDILVGRGQEKSGADGIADHFCFPYLLTGWANHGYYAFGKPDGMRVEWPNVMGSPAVSGQGLYDFTGSLLMHNAFFGASRLFPNTHTGGNTLPVRNGAFPSSENHGGYFTVTIVQKSEKSENCCVLSNAEALRHQLLTALAQDSSGRKIRVWIVDWAKSQLSSKEQGHRARQRSTGQAGRPHVSREADVFHEEGAVLSAELTKLQRQQFIIRETNVLITFPGTDVTPALFFPASAWKSACRPLVIMPQRPYMNPSFFKIVSFINSQSHNPIK